MPRKSNAHKYSEKSDTWKRSRASDIAKVILKNLYKEQYEEIYKRVLKEEFGITTTQQSRHKPGVPDKYVVHYSIYKEGEKVNAKLGI